MNAPARARLSLLTAMIIWGSIGLFRRFIPLPSGVIAEFRAVGGAAFLLLLMVFRKDRPDLSAVRKNLLPLILSGTFIGFNWILLFEAYRYTSVAVATLCYYMAPMIVILVSPLLLHERLTGRKLICLLITLAGMALVSGVFDPSSGKTGAKGVLLGLAAAVLYAGVMLTNKRISGVPAMDKTISQLSVAAVVLLPYVLLTESAPLAAYTPLCIAMLAVVAVVHTGLSYALYFGSMKDLPAQTVALMSYIDPVVAVLLSALVLKEPMSLPGALGAALILGAVIACELPEKQK
ncbi:MAG: EamA family transporter [Clostridia bacterium]|nr:EamA family transporter [Clostridia bacterium]